MSAQTSWGATFIGEYENQFTRMKREGRRNTSSFLYMTRRWLEEAKKKGGLSITNAKCACLHNHFAIKIGEEVVCPIRFWLGVATLAYVEKESVATLFIERHPIKEVAKRVDESRDATYRPEMEIKKELTDAEL